MPPERLINVPVSGGVDARTDPRAIQPPKLARAENVTFEKPGALRKRPGFLRHAIGGSANGMTQTMRCIADRDGELVAFDGRDLFSYASALGSAFMRVGRTSGTASEARYSRAACARITGRRGMTTSADETMLHVDQATNFGVTVHVGYTAKANKLYWYAIDETTGAVLRAPVLLGASLLRPRVVAVASSILMFWADTGATSIRAYAITAANVLTTTGAGTAVVNDCTSGVFDVVESENGVEALLAWHATAGSVKWNYVTTALAKNGADVVEVPAAAPFCVAIAEHRTGDLRVALAWGSIVGAGRVDVRTWSSAKAALTAAFQIEAARKASNITAAWHATNSLRVFYSVKGASSWLDAVYTGTLAAVGTLFVAHSSLQTRAWSDGTATGVLVVVGQVSDLQNTYFVMRYAESAVETAQAVMARLAPATGGAFPAQEIAAALSYLPGVQKLSTGLYRWAGVEEIAKSRQLIEYTYDDTRAPSYVAVAGQLYWAGGYVGHYDGQRSLELGFLLYPENWSLFGYNGAGVLTPSSSYGVRVYLERRTRAGVERSTALTKTVALAAGEDTIDVTIITLAHTLDKKYNELGCYFAVYATAANGSIYYRVGEIQNDDTSTGTLTYTITSVSTTAAQDYLSATPAPREQLAPPACAVMAEVNGRVWLGGLVSDPSELRYSLLRETLEPLSFSDENVVFVPGGKGDLTGLVASNTALVAFRERGIYTVSGPGPDNAGNNGAFADPVPVSEDLGCAYQASVVRVPPGILFQGEAGIWMLGGGGLQYVGADAEDLVTAMGSIVTAAAHTKRGEVWFGADLGTSILVYNYLTQAWSTIVPGDTGARIKSLCIRDGFMHYGTSDSVAFREQTGKIDQDDAGTNLPYSQVIETPWIHVADMQAEERILGILFAGKYEDSHKPRVRIAYDYAYADAINPTWTDTKEWTATADSFWQFEVRPSRQRCTAIKLELSDQANVGMLGSSFILNAIAVRVSTAGAAKPVAPTKRAA